MATTYKQPAVAPALRTKSITLHITEEFYDECVRRAGRTPLCEWARREFETHVARKPIELRMIEELLALRYILVNALPAPTEIDTFIKEADETKAAQARALLDGAR